MSNINEAAILEEIKKNRFGCRQIADKYGVNRNTLYWIHEKHGLSSRQLTKERLTRRNNRAMEDLVAGATVKQVCKKYKLKRGTVYMMIQKMQYRYCRQTQRWLHAATPRKPPPTLKAEPRPDWEVMRIFYGWKTCYG